VGSCPSALFRHTCVCPAPFVSTSEVYGNLAYGPLKGELLSGLAGDQQGVLFGNKCLAQGQAKCTGAFMLSCTGTDIVYSKHGLLCTVRPWDRAKILMSFPTGSIIYLLQTSWVGSSDAVPAIEGKTPGSKPRDLSTGWAFFSPLASSEVYECQSPGDSSELPGYLDSSLPARNTTTVHLQYLRSLACFVCFFQPPSTTLFRS
jgi:glycerol kinase